MIIPAKGRVLISKLTRKDVESAAGVLLPGQNLQEESLLYGEMMSDGEDHKKGTKIWYSKYSATSVRDDKGKEFYLISELDIMAHDA